MDTAIIFGAAGMGERVYERYKNMYRIIGFCDNDPMKRGTKRIQEAKFPVYAPNELSSVNYDVIILGSFVGFFDIKRQLAEMNIPKTKIVEGYIGTMIHARILFLERLAEEFSRKGIVGCVAEAGVFRGEFAKEINRCFPHQKCYLFDTFDGFNEQDTALEQKPSLVEAHYMKKTAEEIVLQKMPKPQMVEIRKGHFPDSAHGLDDMFCFVNLDMDLYKPTYEGIKLFYPKMAHGGVILIHDYYSEFYPNVHKAVDDSEAALGVKFCKIPIGDDWSIAIIKA